jgi:mRNA interferase YafQ
MKYILHPTLRKRYKKLPVQTKGKLDARLLIFSKDELSPVLNNHSLRGEYEEYRSINITGDYRAIYFIDKDVAVFIRIGTHSELFGK